MFWQTALAVVLGVMTGVIILSFMHKRPAEALTRVLSPTSVPASPSNGFPNIQILPMLSERMTVLVMGVDSNGRNTERFTGTRSDTMILVSLDPVTHKVGMVSIPRDSRVKISSNHATDKINSAHALGGPELAVQTVGEVFSVPVDHYVVVDTQGLKELCELLGPVEVLVEKEMHYHDWAAHLHVDLKPGLQILDPGQVEQYVRFRHDARGDIGRIERQQWFFRQAANKMKDPQFLLRLPELVKLAHDYVHTDLSIEDMARIANFGKDIKPADVVTATLPGEPKMIGGGSYWLPDMDGCRVVFNRVLGLSGGGNFVDQPLSGNGEASEKTQAASGGGDMIPLSARPLVLALKYPRGSESTAGEVEALLRASGYAVRYKWQVPVSDCQHEQIVQMSARADEDATSRLRKSLPDLRDWPVVLSIESRPVADFTLMITPKTRLVATAASTGTAACASSPTSTQETAPSAAVGSQRTLSSQ